MEKITVKPLVVILGAGAFGTALGNALALNKDITVKLLTIEKEVCDSINNQRVNIVYFPNAYLRKNLQATMDPHILKRAWIIILAVPSGVCISYIEKLRSYINPRTVIINTAKGLGEGNEIISEYIETHFLNPVCALKGPSFAVELLKDMPTAFTLASKNTELFEKAKKYINGTQIRLDFSEDIRGVELVSIMKNMYAIIMGVVDAHYNSTNVRFMVLTKVFNELHKALILFGGKPDTIFHYCGYGDFGLTSLNDLSRNRTMGLLIGKGFIKDMVSDNIVLEGKRTLTIFYKKIADEKLIKNVGAEFPILLELYKLFSKEYDQRVFILRILNAANIVFTENDYKIEHL